jgi:uncharacterized iron-regulated membrane protein
MMRVRPLLFWLHVSLAVSAAAVVLVMAATGVLLTYQRQIVAWADTRGIAAAPPDESARMQAPETLLAAALAVDSGRATAMRFHADPSAPVEVWFGRDRALLLDAYTGAVLGRTAERPREFFRAVTDLHRWLALRGDGVRAGRAITGAANFVFLFIVLSGLVLWWPRNTSARALRSVMLFRRGLRARARDFNWHNVAGIWSALPLLVIIASGVVISYGWAGNLVNRLGDSPATPAAEAPFSNADLPGSDTLDIRALLDRATRALPEWRTITLELPARTGTYTFLIDSGNGAQPHRQAELTLAASGAALEWKPFASGSRAARVRSILRFAHTGEVLGAAGQTVAGLASLGALLLVWTGLSLALRRLRAWRGRRSRTAPTA